MLPPAPLKAPCWDQHFFPYILSYLSEAVSSAPLNMYADDTTIYCMGKSVDLHYQHIQ